MESSDSPVVPVPVCPSAVCWPSCSGVWMVQPLSGVVGSVGSAGTSGSWGSVGSTGVVGSVVSKVATLVGKDGSDYVLTGGLCDEPFLVEQLSFALGASVRTCSLARYAGALGAAESALS